MPALPLLRPPTLGEVLQKNLPPEKRRDLIVDPDGGIFSVRNLGIAVRRASRGDVVHVPSGEYPSMALSKGMEIRSLQNGVVRFKGTMTISTEHLIVLSGFTFQPEPGSPALVLEKGALLLEDCTVEGNVLVGSPGETSQLFLQNSLIANGIEGVTVRHRAMVEVHTSRIAGCRVGVSLDAGTSCAIYNSRLEACVSADEANPGAGIIAEEAAVYCEGVTFSHNSIGAYLTKWTEARILCCHFHASETAALIARHEPSSPPLRIDTCTIGGQATAHCAQMAFTGGSIAVQRTTVHAAPASVLSLDQARLDIRESRLFSRSEPAIDARSSHLTAQVLVAVSEKSAGLAASSCQGLLRGSIFAGRPPTAVDRSPQLILEACESRETLTEDDEPEETEEPLSTVDEVMNRLKKSVSQEVVRNELERILRLAHAAQQRRLEGLPVPNQTFHSVFMGPSGTGKLTAAELLAHGLHAFGVLSSPQVQELSLSVVNGTHKPHPGVIFVRAEEATGSEPEQEAARAAIERLVGLPGEIVVIDGERDELRRLLRQSPVLERSFRHTVYFTNFGPLELAALFVELCENDRIPVSIEATRTILLAFHLYCERRDRRFANTRGVEMLFESTRRRYLRRCSIAQSVDLELEPSDVEVPQDKALLTAIERCPAFVSFCPACTKENPWLPGLNPKAHCLHCDTPYTANWGVWKDSATYRRMQENLNRTAPAEGMTVIPRASLPPIH